MFNSSTVFVLGAGASWHYGYPTGEQLVKLVTKKSKELADFCKRSQGNNLNERICNRHVPDFFNSIDQRLFSAIEREWYQYEGKFRVLYNKLIQIHPTVIDYFLEENPSIQELGKLVIAWVLLECEQKQNELNINPNRLPNKEPDNDYKDNWYRFIINKLSSNASRSEDLHKNNIYFVTFNYDLSLENVLFNALCNIDTFEEHDVVKFIKERVIHIYGQIGYNTPEDELTFLKDIDFSGRNNLEKKRLEYRCYFNIAHKASQNIRTINGAEKENDDILNKAIQQIHTAQELYFLGYGFDVNNNKRLKLNEALKFYKHNYKRFFFTNYGDSNIVNKRISHLIWGHEDNDKNSFLPPNPVTHGNYRRPPYYEKSIRNVYDAFQDDFDL